MKNFSDYIPPDLLNITNVRSFVSVLDELHIWDDLYESEQRKSFNPILNSNINFLKRFLYELGQIKTVNGMPRKAYEELIKNAYDIFTLKGTREGFLLLISSACLGDAEVEYTNLWATPFISPDDYQAMVAPYSTGVPTNYVLGGSGFLPNATDLGNTGNLPGVTPIAPFYFLLGNMTDHYNEMNIILTSPFFCYETFRVFIANMVPYFLPMVYIPTCTLNLYFNDYDVISKYGCIFDYASVPLEHTYTDFPIIK